MSTVIGIHDGHNASVAVVRDGRLELALQEERLTRVKNQGDAPVEALQAARQLIGVEPVQVALNGRYTNYGQWQRDTIAADYDASQTWGSRARQLLKKTPLDKLYRDGKARHRQDRLIAAGVPGQKMQPIDHHMAHAAAAYYTSKNAYAVGKVLVLTADGSGDRLSATVNIGENGHLTRIASIPEEDSLGRLFAMVTRWLGMMPQEHEYKVMGLAPYGGTSPLARDFSELFEFTKNPLIWRRRRGIPSMYSDQGWLRRALKNERFDRVAAAVQNCVEVLLTAWIGRAIRETGIRKIACAGGLFMNVKANLAILELPEVEEMHVAPSCGDESSSIGAAYWLAAENGEQVQPPGPIYYGDPITDEEAERALEGASARLRFRHCADVEKATAQALAQGKIVARATGSMEFGARALGNRSILAPANSTKHVRTINRMIKGRDFWMPFAPSVLANRAGDYYEKPKQVVSPYMMLAFRSKASKREAFSGAQHPYDGTTRPQEVFPQHNPAYHALLQEYESCTGEGILLNTSFNLHGEPIVCRARDAVRVFERSGLQYMALGNWWVEKHAV